jgi:predicted RNase H-like HicB family nuclease
MRYYMAVIEKGESNCSAYCPDLPGCITTGKTLDDTVRNMTEAVQFHTEGLPEDRDPVPRPGNPQARIGEINTEAGDLFAFIPVPEPGNIAAEIPAARERHPEPVAV